MCSSEGAEVQQTALPAPQQQGWAAFLQPLHAVRPHCSLYLHQTSTSVLRAYTTAASSASTPLGHTAASATQASVPLIRLPAGAWVSTCSAQAALAAEMIEVPSCAHSPSAGWQNGQTVAVEELVE